MFSSISSFFSFSFEFISLLILLILLILISFLFSITSLLFIFSSLIFFSLFCSCSCSSCSKSSKFISSIEESFLFCSAFKFIFVVFLLESLLFCSDNIFPSLLLSKFVDSLFCNCLLSILLLITSFSFSFISLFCSFIFLLSCLG